MAFAEVAIPRPLRRTFTYQVPEALAARVRVGMRLVVPFGKRTLRAYVIALHEQNPHPELEVKPIRRVSDESPVLPARMMELACWVADYYFAPLGEVLRSFFPPVSPAATRKTVRLSARGRQVLDSPNGLSSDDRQALALLAAGQPLGLRQWKAQARLETSALRRLVGRRWVEIMTEQSAHESYGKKIQAVRRSPLPLAGKITERQKKVLEWVSQNPGSIARIESELGVSRAVIAALMRKGLLEAAPQTQLRRPSDPEASVAGRLGGPLTLTAAQIGSIERIVDRIEKKEHRAVVLHGVTGSGKTEIYLQAIMTVLQQGRAALVLLPEIALTPRALELFRDRFGERVAILHSALSAGERNDEWWRIRRGQAAVVIGTRSAVFAPLSDIGLIVVDEEHDTSYKQEESPVYNGRDVAIYRAHLERATVVLSSATPALETYFQAVEKKKFDYISLPQRVQQRPLPTVHIVDMREEFNKFGKAAIISEFLRDQLRLRLDRREQVIILLNRRGYYAFMLCRSCGNTLQCHNCSITLTYHRAESRMVCHYCGYSRSVPRQCQHCRGQYIYFLGEGTEKIEEILGKLFPAARLARLDRDTTRRRGSLERILGRFAAQQTDILIGTQMLAKGHDFPNVTLVGVLSADLSLRLPDFRSAERTFQLLTQVAGRSGRGDVAGDVVIQSYYPNHYSLRYACQHNYREFYAQEVKHRQNFMYPPFCALANLVVQHGNRSQACKLASRLGRALVRWRDRVAGRPVLRVIGPAAAAIERIQGRYRYQIILKSSDRRKLHDVLQLTWDQLERERFPLRQLRIDVDPVSLL